MKVIKCDLPDQEQVEIVVFADEHVGDAACDFKRLLERIEYVKNTPGCYCILNGDLMDCAIANSVGDSYGAELSPMNQLQQCVKIFGGIKDKILCVTPGNHENRVYKQTGLSMTEVMCSQLGIPEKCTPTTALLFVRFGKRKANHHGRRQLYTIYVTHGSGGGRKEGGKINRLADLAAIVDSDIYLCAHTHLPAVFRNAFHRVSGSNSSVSIVDKLFVNTASNLDYGGYGDLQGYKPCSKQSPTIYLNGTERAFWAKL